MKLHAIEEHADGAVQLTGLDSAIIGIVEDYAGSRLLYSKDKIITILCKSMTEEEAMEYYDYNILGLFGGEQSPVFLIENLRYG